jgi:phenylalanyl-tRNA synthetase beta chain
VDFFDAKGVAESLCDALGIILTFEPTVQNFLVPGRATLVRGTKDEHRAELGYLGQLEPELAISRGFPSTGGPIYVFELSLDALDAVSVDRNNLQTKSIPRHPSITRDIAIVIDASLPASTVRDTIQASAPNTLVSVREFDYYDGKGVPKDCVSLALRLNFRASNRTLTDKEIQKVMDAVIKELELKHNAKLR